MGGPPWLRQTVDLVVISAPSVAAVLVAAAVAARARFWRRMLALRWTDVVLGLGVGLFIRALIEVVTPSTGTLLGGISDGGAGTIIVLAVGAALVTPFVEELYFRGLVVASVAQSTEALGRIASSVVAVVVATAGFVALHVIAAPAPPPWLALAGPVAVSVGGGILLLVTGRLGGAVTAHVTFNAIGVALLIW